MSSGNQDSYSVNSKSSAYQEPRSDYYQSTYPNLLGHAAAAMSDRDRVALFKRILDNKIHGISYSPYMDGQEPGVHISPEQIRERMSIIAPYTNWVRCFSCIEGNQEAPRIAHEMGLKTMVGIGIGEERDKNEEEMTNGIAVARAGHADILAVGNEVMLRGDVSEDELIEYIERAKEACPGVPVGYVDAYFLFEKHPRVREAVDVVLINCYPFWESCQFEYSLLYMKEMYRRIKHISGNKPVIISETGWPSVGAAYGAAVPGPENAMNYFINTALWAEEEGIEFFYFSSFDESWKVGDEGDVGAYWGLWDKDGNLKYE